MSFYRKYEKAILASTKASEIESSRPRFIQVFCFHTSSRCFVLTCRPGVLFSHAVKLFVTRRYFHHYYLQLEKGRRNTELLHSPLSQKHERPINPPVHVFCSNQSYLLQRAKPLCLLPISHRHRRRPPPNTFVTAPGVR
jgi:hypothetical protein